jgi:hypothetical protein
MDDSPRSTLNKYVPSSEDAGNAMTSSSSVALSTVIWYVSQYTIGAGRLPKFIPRSVTVFVLRSTFALVMSSCRDLADSFDPCACTTALPSSMTAATATAVRVLDSIEFPPEFDCEAVNAKRGPALPFPPDRR